MTVPTNDAQEFREVQGARVARWLRDSEAGHLFLGSDGEFYHIFESEAAAFERHLQDWIESGATKALSSTRSQPYERTAVALFVCCFPAASASHFLALICFLTSIVSALAAGYAGNLSDARYERGLRKWRAKTTARLKEDGRAGVPEEIAQRSRRHNLFRWAMLAHIPIVLGCYAAMGFRPGDDRQALIFTGLIVVLIVSMIIFEWAARRVDATHRRRKWLD